MGFFDDVLKPGAEQPPAAAGGFFADVLAAPERAKEPQSGNLSRTFTDVPAEISAAASGAGTAINQGLNPVSDTNRAITEKAGSGSLFDFTPEIERLKSTGS